MFLFVCGGCLSSRSDKGIASDAAASWAYHDARYERLCIHPPGVAVSQAQYDQCLKYKAAIDELKWQSNTANVVQGIGTIPPEERAAIKSAMSAVSVLP